MKRKERCEGERERVWRQRGGIVVWLLFGRDSTCNNKAVCETMKSGK